jgi:hypothetical protein
MYHGGAVCLYSAKPPPYGAVEHSREGSQTMRHIRSLLTQAPATVISLAAIVLSLGGGAAYASTHHTATQAPVTSHASAAGQVSAATGVTWQGLTLKNGWASSNSIYGTGNPKAALQNGIVYLSGSLHQSTSGSAVFASLPRAYRPTHNLYITIYTNGGTQGSLYIGADGTMEAFSSGSCGSLSTAQCFSSLATVSYPLNS